MIALSVEKCIEELQIKGCVVDSFTVTKQDEYKIIADVLVKYENQATISACLKAYDVSRFEQIERVYTILNLLATKLKEEAKKKNETFINLLPVIYESWKREDLYFTLEEKIEGTTLAENVLKNEYNSFPASL